MNLIKLSSIVLLVSEIFQTFLLKKKRKIKLTFLFEKMYNVENYSLGKLLQNNHIFPVLRRYVFGDMDDVLTDWKGVLQYNNVCTCAFFFLFF